MPMGHGLEDLPGDKIAELDLALLVAGRTEAPPLATDVHHFDGVGQNR